MATKASTKGKKAGDTVVEASGKKKAKQVSTVRSESEIVEKAAVLNATRTTIEELHSNGEIDDGVYNEYTTIIDNTLALLNWFLGHDVEHDSSNNVLKSVLLAKVELPYISFKE